MLFFVQQSHGSPLPQPFADVSWPASATDLQTQLTNSDHRCHFTSLQNFELELRVAMICSDSVCSVRFLSSGRIPLARKNEIVHVHEALSVDI